MSLQTHSKAIQKEANGFEVRQIDDHHAKLFKIFDVISRNPDDVISSESFQEAFGAFMKAVLEDFSAEEALLRSYGMKASALDQHVADHLRLLGGFNQVIDGAKAGGHTLTRDVCLDLKAELLEHINKYHNKLLQDLKTESDARAVSKIDEQILAIETQELLLRPMREALLETLLNDALSAGLSEDNLLDKSHAAYDPEYERIYKLHARIDELRKLR